MKRQTTFASIFLMIVLAAGCSEPTSVESMPDDGVHGAIIEWEGERDIRIPETAVVDQPVTIDVGMWVGGSVAPDELLVVVTHEGFRIEATADYGSGWLDRWAPTLLTVELQFPEIGEFEVEVVGRSLPGYVQISHVEHIEVAAASQ